MYWNAQKSTKPTEIAAFAVKSMGFILAEKEGFEPSHGLARLLP